MTEEKKIEVLIVGAGTIGQIYGYHLQKSGANVHFYIREHNKEKMTKYPLRIHKLSSVFRWLNKSKTEEWSNYDLITDTDIANNNDTLPDNIDYVIFAVPADKFNQGEWLPKLINLLNKKENSKKIMYVTPIPDESGLTRLTDLGITNSQLISAQINSVCYFAPLVDQSYEPRDAEMVKKDDESENPNKVVVCSQVGPELFGSFTEEAKNPTDQLITLLKKSDFLCGNVQKKLLYGVYAIVLMPLFMIATLCNWNFLTIAKNYSLMVITNASISEICLIQMKKFKEINKTMFYLLIYTPTIFLSLGVLVAHFLSVYVCSFDIEAFCKTHFGIKLTTQTEYWIDLVKSDSKKYEVDITNLEKLVGKYNEFTKKGQ